ncbi:MAG: IS110 family transposase [Breznakibacter sp.]
MKTPSTKIDFSGQNFYAGIDIHLKSWKVPIIVNEREHKTFSQNSSAELLYNYLKKNFPGAVYHSAYEAGFCGFNSHRELKEVGINNIIINPADIPTTDKEKKQKEDKRDSRKIVKSLKNGDLKGIYVPSKEMEELRGLVRYRKTLVKEISRHKCRIKSFLYFNGFKLPLEKEVASQHWSGRFMQWLKDIELSTIEGKVVHHDTLILQSSSERNY